MLLTVALVVVCCAIVVMFSQEFANFFKRIFAIRGMKLLLPLILASTLVVYYDPWVSWGLLQTKRILHTAAATIANWLSFKEALIVANIIILMGLAVLPVAIANFWIKHKSFEPFRFAFITSMVIWLIVAILLTVNYSYS
ncbi:hypothetical protein [Legionella brunensis]|uniref:Transmembrane protein n=1 Tax=Legionella brunensis TaxID=29422 RepID=A0A0W0S159_9GAMM|nr:hypothetical protein [Legionella brunensis]KTC77035.1 hypothetical protein Lbru_3142 [Legionella brunensis]